MTHFSGFPARMQFTPVPNLFFSSLLPRIDDIVELKVTLHIFRAVYSKKGNIRFVTRDELLNDRSLVAGLRDGDKTTSEVLGEALKMAVKRGTLIHLVLSRDGAPEDVYFLNTEADRKIVDKIKDGEMALTGLKAGGQSQPDVDIAPPPDVFTLYEQNVGMLTPMIAEELREAEKIYPGDWIREAIAEAVKLNKRSWRYIERILERWLAEGKGDGTYRGDIKKSSGKLSQQGQGQIFRR
ncbi:MAG: DnaD domain protein [Chloroflexi bacterium]|nr:DnaD domain protein [Chloroflexota bacterium]